MAAVVWEHVLVSVLELKSELRDKCSAECRVGCDN